MTIDDSGTDPVQHPFWISHPRALVTSTRVAIVLAGLGEIVFTASEGFRIGGALGLLLLITGLVVWERRPVVGLLMVAAAPLVTASLGDHPVALWTMTVFSGFLFAYRGVAPMLTGIVITVCNYVSVVVGLGFTIFNLEAAIAGVSAIASVALGATLNGQRRYWMALQKNARDALAARGVEAERRLAEERLGIARDLHDVVGHEVAVLSVQLSAVEVALPPDAELARSRAALMRSAIQSILSETKEILDVLRSPEDDDALRPTPNLDRLRELVSSYQTIGLAVDLKVDELPPHIDPSVSTAAYRIVQEALTNAHRHGSGTAQLTIVVKDASMTITITNHRDTVHPATAGSGYGLIGIRERAKSANGSVNIETNGDVFQLTARLPLAKGSRA